MADTYLLTGGGTGGHIFPAVAVAQKIQELNPGAKIVFIGARRGIESRVFPEIGFSYHLLSVGPLNFVSMLRKVFSLIQLPFAILISVLLILRYRPISIIGFGGYASAPLVIAASILRRRFYLWEGNAHPGMVTRKVVSRAQKIFLAFPSSNSLYEKYSSEVVGVPTRFKAEINVDKSPSSSNSKTNVFIFGGSQGARAINLAVFDMLNNYGDSIFEKFNIIHQVGKSNMALVPSELKSIDGYQAFEFIHDIKQKYQWADMVICRAGASTVSELTQMGLAAIYIPLPSSADDHQKKNALWVETSGAGLLLEQKNLTGQNLMRSMDSLNSESILSAMSEKSSSIAKSGAAEAIAKQII